MKFNARENEQLLNASKSDFSLFAEALPHIVWMAAPDGATQFVNRRATDYTGHSRSATLAWNWVSLVHPEDAGSARRAWQTALQTGTKCEIQYRLRRADGEFRWHALCNVPVHGSDGQVAHWIGSATDIDDQKKLETQFRFLQGHVAESSALIATLHAHSPVGLGFVDRDFRMVQMNAALASFNGTPMEQQVGRTVAELVPELWPRLEPVYRGVLDTGKPVVNVEVVGKVPSRPGETGYWLANYHPVILDNVAIGVALVVIDITEQKQADLRLHAAEVGFRSLIEQSITATFIVQDGRFSFVNDRFAQLFGYALPTELIGSEPMSLVVESDRGPVKKNLRRTAEAIITTWNYEGTGLRKDGSTFEVGVHGSAASYNGRPAIVGSLQDISERKRIEAQTKVHVEQLERAFMHSVEVAMTLGEMRDPYTAGHEKRVAEIAVAIGAALGFDSHGLQCLRVSALLHDIGKITVPAEILTKPTKLTAAEYELIKGHPQASFDVLKSVEFPWPVAQVVLQHHERLDGSGYPQALKGDAIRLEARILAVADVVEAMSSHRPYRAGLGIEKALAEIERGRGVLYDPAVVDVCLALFRDKACTLPT